MPLARVHRRAQFDAREPALSLEWEGRAPEPFIAELPLHRHEAGGGEHKSTDEPTLAARAAFVYPSPMDKLVREPLAAYPAPPRVLPCHTWEDYAGWEGDWELIRGVPFSLDPPPKIAHALACTQLVLLLQTGLSHEPSWTVLSRMDWIVDDHTTIRPDVMVARAPLGDDWLRKSPELVVEVLSPSTAAKDRIEKRALCDEAKVPYFLLIDPARKTLEAFAWRDTGYEEVPMRGDAVELALGERVVRLALTDLFLVEDSVSLSASQRENIEAPRDLDEQLGCIEALNLARDRDLEIENGCVAPIPSAELIRRLRV